MAFTQVKLDGLQLQSLSGDIGAGYDGSYGTLGSSHDINLTGDENLNGYYYNPNFFNFNLNSYYGRTQENSTGASLTNTEGYLFNGQIFGGSPMPGGVSLGQSWGQTEAYGVPGLTGLNSTVNSSSFAVGWLFKNLPVKNLSVSFGDISSGLSIPGFVGKSTDKTRSFGVSSGGYRLAGFSLGGSFTYARFSEESDLFTGVEEKGAGDFLSFQGQTQRKIPRGSFTLMAGHSTETVSSDGQGSQTSTTQVDSVINSYVWRLPLSGSVTYNDNYYANLFQELNSSGQGVVVQQNIPGVGTLQASVGSSYTFPNRVFVTGFLTHNIEFVQGQRLGSTSGGANVAYGFGRFFKGLTLIVGMHDNASQVGNTGAALQASATYRNSIGHWRFTSNAGYDQSIQTLFALYNQSEMNANVALRRELHNGLKMNFDAGYGRSLFSSGGGGSSSQHLTAEVSWLKQSLSASYGKSGGEGITTTAGVVPVTTPGLSSAVEQPFSGESYTIAYNNALVKHVTVNLAWSRFLNSMGNNVVPSSTLPGIALPNATSTTYNGYLTYNVRKLNFYASAIRSIQGAIGTTTLPSNITVYSFGVSRWFKFF